MMEGMLNKEQWQRFPYDAKAKWMGRDFTYSLSKADPTIVKVPKKRPSLGKITYSSTGNISWLDIKQHTRAGRILRVSYFYLRISTIPCEYYLQYNLQKISLNKMARVGWDPNAKPRA